MPCSVGAAGDDLRQGDAAATTDQGAVHGLRSSANLACGVSRPHTLNQDEPGGLTPNAVLETQKLSQGVELFCIEIHFLISQQEARHEPGL